MPELSFDYYLHNDPRLSWAWAPWFSHEYINYFSVNAFSKIMDLPPVPLKPNPRNTDDHWAIGPRHVDLYKESHQIVRQLDPFNSFAYETRNGDFSTKPPLDVSIEPWKILVLYGTEPDLLLDCDLMLDKRQKLTGGSHGWRHMQFNVFGLRIGVLLDSFKQNTRLARLAMNQENDYWGWRYLSRCMHYLADMGHPFHVKTAPTGLLLKIISSYTELFRIISTAHQSYEIYVEHRFREGFPVFKEALTKGALEGISSNLDVMKELHAYVRRSRNRLKPIFNFIIDQFGQELIDVYGHIDQNSKLDASKQINLCSENASKIIFNSSRSFSLDFLDKITAEILFDVGKMMGSFLSQFQLRHS